VDRLLGELSAFQFAQWAARYEIEPFGEAREDARHGLRAAILANVHRDPKAKPFEPQDFIPRFRSPEKVKQSPAQQLKVVELWNKALGGRDRRGH